MNENIGPNVKRLIAMRVSMILIPPGIENPFTVGIAGMMNDEKRTQAVREATAWVKEALRIFKTAPDNPYGDDDEAIAGAIIEQADKRLKP